MACALMVRFVVVQQDLVVMIVRGSWFARPIAVATGIVQRMDDVLVKMVGPGMTVCLICFAQVTPRGVAVTAFAWRTALVLAPLDSLAAIALLISPPTPRCLG